MCSFPQSLTNILIVSTLFSTFFSITTNAVFSEDVTNTINIKPKEKTTHLHFYFHDVISGENSTVVQVAGPSFGFGSTTIMDDPLTEGPDPTSKIVGRSQGIYANAAQNGASLLMVTNFGFSEGEFNGSSISILGRNRIMDDVREMPVVGGCGVFRFARGYALAHTVSISAEVAVVEYNVYVSYLDSDNVHSLFRGYELRWLTDGSGWLR